MSSRLVVGCNCRGNIFPLEIFRLEREAVRNARLGCNWEPGGSQTHSRFTHFLRFRIAATLNIITDNNILAAEQQRLSYHDCSMQPCFTLGGVAIKARAEITCFVLLLQVENKALKSELLELRNLLGRMDPPPSSRSSTESAQAF
jgi:hypothetical protein